MKSHILSKALAAVLSLIALLLFQACSAVDNSAYFESYEKAYQEKVDYTAHLIMQDGLKIYAREYGTGNSGPTFVMMHGFPDSMHLYDRLIPLLSRDRHIVAFDFIGWGDSDKPKQHRYDVASLRKNLERVIEYFGLTQVIPVVHDASGQPGIDWAMDNPDKTARLVLLNTFYSPMPTLVAPEAIALFSTPGIRRDLTVWATRNFDALWMSRYNEQIAKFISNEAVREPFLKLLGHQSLQIRNAFYGLNRVLNKELQKRQGKTVEMTAFQPPVRIIFGNDDPYLNAGVARELHRLLPRSELFLIENAGHFVQIDDPEQVAALLRDFPLPDDSDNIKERFLTDK